jgi:hypothetical protein
MEKLFMIKLFDAQVITLMLIAFREPPKPQDMSRYPTIQMFLDNGLVAEQNGRLVVVDPAREEIRKYKNVFPSTHRQALETYSSFEEMETKSLVVRGEQVVKRWFFYDAIQLCDSLEKLGVSFPAEFSGAFKMPLNNWKTIKCFELINSFKDVYAYPAGPLQENQEEYRKRLRRSFPEIDSVLAEASETELERIGLINKMHRQGWIKLSYS